MRALASEHAAPGALAALHAALHAPAIANYFRRGALLEEDANKRRRNSWALVQAFAALAQLYWGEAGDGPLDCTAVCQALDKVAGKRAGRALQSLLKGLHDGLGRTKVVEGAPARLALRGDALEAWDRHNEQAGYSVLTELLQGQRAVGGTHEHFWALDVGAGQGVQAMLDATCGVTHAPLLLCVCVPGPTPAPAAVSLADCDYHLFATDSHCALGGQWACPASCAASAPDAAHMFMLFRRLL